MHGYIIILPLPHMTSEARAYGISRELYNITVPLAIQEDYHKDGIVFGVVTVSYTHLTLPTKRIV